jgi:hypothetical protein
MCRNLRPSSPCASTPTTRVTAANAEAQRLLGAAVVGRPFADLLVAFTRPADLSHRLRQAGVSHRFTLDTAAQLPETVDFPFLPHGRRHARAGQSRFSQEQLALRNQVLALNGELNNVTRQLHQTNAELRELNAFEKPVPRHGRPRSPPAGRRDYQLQHLRPRRSRPRTLGRTARFFAHLPASRHRHETGHRQFSRRIRDRIGANCGSTRPSSTSGKS